MTSWKRVLSEGLVAGFIGYVVVVLLFALLNVIAGRSPFHTAGLLGEAVFYGRHGPAGFVVAAGPALAYNGAHLVLFLVFGVIAAWLVAVSEFGPQFWYIAVIAFIFVLTHMVGAAVLLSASVREFIPIWSVVLATLLAGGAMTYYLWRAHPRLRSEESELTLDFPREAHDVPGT